MAEENKTDSIPTTFSPVPSKSGEKQISFAEVVGKLLEGKKIHKLEWADKGYYVVIADEVLKLHKPDGKLYRWTLKEADLIGSDYIVI